MRGVGWAPVLCRIDWLLATNQQAIAGRITNTRTVATGMYLTQLESPKPIDANKCKQGRLSVSVYNG
jgi:hypothetical protein